ncbi:hypothetical protein OZN62_08125 [Aurantiacibacter sp. MUD11]|nr:hypothetical protein [Aurantiacibacter sp. MUD11]WAT16906.1 hypothetical protein OZN62_08125 [Aurantiacibacter sp. MUD11]
MARQRKEHPARACRHYVQDEAIILAQMHGDAMPQPQQFGEQPHPQVQAE